MSIGSYFASNALTGANLSPSYIAPYTLQQNIPSLSTPQTSGFSFDLLKGASSASDNFSLGGTGTGLSTDSFLSILNDQANQALYKSFDILKAYQANLQQDFNRVNNQISALGYQGINPYI